MRFRSAIQHQPPSCATFVFVAMLAVGCVSQGKYDAALAGAARQRSEHAAESARVQQRLAATQAELERWKQQLAETEARCKQTEDQGAACAASLDEATAMNAGLRGELERLGKDVNQLLAARGTLAGALEQARARLEELRRAEAASKERAALFREVALKLKRMIDAGELQVLLRSGRMVLVLPNDVLFDSGKAEVKARGKQSLAAVATVLASLEGRKFQVAGHTDDQPIRFSGFASNWELSTERGLRVVEFLLKSGMKAETLSAAGYGEFDPVVPNDSADNRTKNRRIEITLEPRIDELVAVPEVP
ncbi:MAG: OmpA family protein [Myxococcota bacterium]|jgi:chemotaxis protein MotB|nr:OmpA family protein [Myxococcota bacterium]